METSELTGAALDWAVEKCEGKRDTDFGWWWDKFHPSTNWAQGGPIIERERIAIRENADSPDWYACKRWDSHGAFGQTPLIAAMRCYVASKLGNEVDVPEELTGVNK